MNSSDSASNRYEIMKGRFWCQQCNQEVNTSRVYKSSLDITWMCKACDYVSVVNIYQERGY